MNILESSFDRASLPSWDLYYLSIAFMASRRSIDQHTKCGCIIVSKDNRPLTMGYNGPIKGSKDENIPLTRPEKYFWLLHSEENALLSYSGPHSEMVGGTCYITIKPCHHCLRALIQRGIKRIVISDLAQSTLVESSAYEVSVQEKMMREHGIECTYIDIKDVVRQFEDCIAYIDGKILETYKQEYK